MAANADTRPILTEDERFGLWVERLARRTYDELTFPEVRRGLQALSALYVARRDRIARGAALDGRGKRAAFAVFYGPLHYLVVRHVVPRLGLDRPGIRTVVDLGCGTGAAGAAFALMCDSRPVVRAIDVHPWAVAEANRTYDDLGIAGHARRGRIERFRPADRARDRAVVVGWVVNELEDRVRDALLDRLVESARRGTRILVLEPIARRPLSWWNRWASAFEAAGGRVDTWKFGARIPEPIARLDRAAGLDHRTLSARTLALGAR